jgi:acyl dehydratase
MTLTSHTFAAINLPEHANNPIHTDAGAHAAGFDGALVAGVTTYAAMTHVPSSAWGLDWLRRGGAAVRFRHPILDGRQVECVVRPDGHAVDATADGALCVEARFVETVVDRIEIRDGDPLTPIEFEAGSSWSDYGERSGDTSGVATSVGLIHPSAWPRIANQFCHEQLVIGPWIHVRSRIAHLDAPAIGAEIRATANVVERIDSRAGRRAVLDVWIEANGRPAAAIEHEAIIEIA